MADSAQQLSDVEVAYQVLLNQGSTLYFRELITKVLESKGRSIHSIAYAMAEVHTQINMDSRFVHMGKGMWGLAEWLPQRGVRHADEPEATALDEVNSRRKKIFRDIQDDYAPGTQANEEDD
ncbi:MAG: DNA-directed polymerase delta subunit [Firmicutes bacterium]|nr:DNA-directed polymerase delta subunit [Bacillota bacterium]